MTTPDTAAPVDDFAAAFASLQTPEGAAAALAPAEEITDDNAPAIPSPTAADVPDAAAAAQPDAPANSAPAPTAAPTPAPESDRLATLEAEIAALRAAAAKPAEVAPTPAPAAPAPAPAPVYSAEEQTKLAKYQEDWPDIHAGEALVRRAEYRELVGYIFEQVQQQLAPLATLAQSQQSRTQYQDLIELVPDYDEVRDKTLAWVDQQPAYLKKAYQDVANSGSASDVADLINRFKKETGYAQAAAPAPAPAAQAPAAPPKVAPNASLPPAAKAAAASLRVVKSGRTEPTASADPNDFDSAFAEFSRLAK